jgi:hypothetical protein
MKCSFELILFTCRPKKTNTGNASGFEKRKSFVSKESADKFQRIKKHNLNNTSEQPVKSGKRNLKLRPQTESKGEEMKKRKRNGVDEQKSHNKKQKDFRKTKSGNNSDGKQRSSKNKRNLPPK